eukprot:gene7856-9221_t
MWRSSHDELLDDLVKERNANIRNIAHHVEDSSRNIAHHVDDSSDDSSDESELSDNVEDSDEGEDQGKNQDKTFYEMIILVTTIQGLVNGFQIYISSFLRDKFKERAEKQGNQYTESEEVRLLMGLDPNFSVVAVLGLFNKGKTHLINKLAGYNLKSGKKVETKGLSFKQTQVGKNLIFLDTAGTATPLEYPQNHEMTKDKTLEIKMLAQKKATELFTQEVSFALADIVIIVVSEMTWPDQEYIKVLQDKLANYTDPQGRPKIHQQLIIVHNYASATSDSDLKAMWRKYVLNTQSGEGIIKDVGNSKGFYIQEINNNVSTFHYAMAREGSEAGKKWNQITIDMINSKIGDMSTTKKRSHIDESIVSAFNQILPNYCKQAPQVQISRVHAPEVSEPLQKVTVEGADKTALIPKYQDKKSAKLHRSWLTRLPEKPKAQGHLQIVPVPSSGVNIELKHDKVEYESHRMLLGTNDAVFSPTYDVILNDKGMIVVVDIPGHYRDEEIDYSDICGTVEARTILNEPCHLLVIEGTRKLYCFHPDSGFVQYKTEDGVKGGRSNRQKGQYKIEILIPNSITPEISDIAHINGVLNIVLRPQKTATKVKERIITLDRNKKNNNNNTEVQQ